MGATIRLWPGILFVAIQWVVLVGGAVLAPTYGVYTVLAGGAIGVVVLLWWLFFSRAPWIERIGAIVIAVAGSMITRRVLIDASITREMAYVFSAPPISLALVVAAALGRRLSAARRRVVLAVAIVLGCLSVALVRTDGVSGAGAIDVHWRWAPTAEDRFLAQVHEEPLSAPAAAPAKPAAATPASAAEAKPGDAAGAPKLEGDWPGFRGPHRDGVVRTASVATDWSRSPPTQLWRRAVGPGWGSFAVAGDLLYTQEQRGEYEVVSAYRLATGQPVWRHRDQARFYESGAGPGPRATPAVHNGRVYSHGGTGVVNALDARTGAVLWSRNSETDTGATRPGWGYAGSPLVIDDAVIVAASGRLVAYDVATGALRWTRITGGGGYSSPHFGTIASVPQVLLLNKGGITSVGMDGAILWESQVAEGNSYVQPTVLDGGDVLVATGGMMIGVGIRRFSVSRQGDNWDVQERWATRGLKPYISDYVVHEGVAYGFDGSILSAIDLATGERKWKGGRYGAGQMLLLPRQNLLLVVSEEGDLALVKASGDGYAEVAKVKAIEGRTWNHPVVVGDVVLVRNGEEMAAFRLPR